jgi:flagellar hook-basal body complex protein FliE
MSSPITSLPPLASPDLVAPVSQGATGSGFGSALAGAIDRVELSQTAASQSVGKFLTGEGEELHETALAVQRAELEFELFMQVRNKVVSAYQEIMRMQV